MALRASRRLAKAVKAMQQQEEAAESDGFLPVHRAMLDFRKSKVALALYEAGGVEQFKMPIAHPTDANDPSTGYLPLHFFIFIQSRFLDADLQGKSEAADMFRWLLRLYPEAAGIKGGPSKKTPYRTAVLRKLPDYYRRLLLRAAPTLDPAELHRLNYEPRRMAMFLSFRAVTATVEAPLLVRLRGESMDLVQRVVSFL